LEVVVAVVVRTEVMVVIVVAEGDVVQCQVCPKNGHEVCLLLLFQEGLSARPQHHYALYPNFSLPPPSPMPVMQGMPSYPSSPSHTSIHKL
ncbi:hypothetical protein A2U01_0042761, partial [Trifolium medium]|nr:hypothetical protein [Trifolium medium]